jgi:hypothetical protein
MSPQLEEAVDLRTPEVLSNVRGTKKETVE